MTATITTATIADAIRAQIPAKIQRMADSATYTGRELRIRTWMLNAVTITHTDRTVTVRFNRGTEYLAYEMGTNLIDWAAEAVALPLDAGLIEEAGPRVLTFTI